MPKISDRRKRFRTKDQIATDVAAVLNADLTWGTQHAVLADAVWAWSEFEGKLTGCRHWSPAAWKIRDEPTKLMHEHVVPKRIIIARLSELRGQATAATVKRVLRDWCVGVVLLRTEDALLSKAGLRAKMPDGWPETSIWARYEHVGVTVLRDPGTAQEVEVLGSTQ